MKRITELSQLQDLAEELGMSPDWHEPDEQDVTAVCYGTSFDNAGKWPLFMGLDLTPGITEMHIILSKEGEDVAAVNLATLFAWAARPTIVTAVSEFIATPCPAGLLPLEGPVVRCVRTDKHTVHRTARGVEWQDPEDDEQTSGVNWDGMMPGSDEPEKDHYRVGSMCGSCDAGLPMDCSPFGHLCSCGGVYPHHLPTPSSDEPEEACRDTTPKVIGYRMTEYPNYLRCLDHPYVVMNYAPVTTEDLEYGSNCSRCGRDLLLDA